MEHEVLPTKVFLSSRLASGAFTSEIGGYMKDASGILKFIFSGPCTASNSMQVELQAVVYLVKAINVSTFSFESCLIYLDSEEVVKYIMKIKAGFPFKNLLEDESWVNIVRKSNLFFNYVRKGLNCGADDLAKQGCDRGYFIQGWS
ncbi:hypothetical protein POM88_041800 [Heracleum sosnowskyi]|uniref:Uncharacterized protein n=1 Tax=Heracleum sosnowskyi TaxID=360622 RepID=A0AAD8HH26_9APIA|nr:hypothetical protein POM88_041800 [Heracleum sosnowskyi]